VPVVQGPLWDLKGEGRVGMQGHQSYISKH
jgi:hypothetical protein